MTKKNKTRNEYVLDALLTGKPLLLTDITRMVSDASGRETKIQDISSVMSKLSSSGQSYIGHFINRKKTPQGYEYSIVPEILRLASEEIYDLTRKTGKDRFTLEMALEKVPELGQYIQKTEKPAVRRKPGIKKPAKKKTASSKKANAGKKAASRKKTTSGKKAAARKPGRKLGRKAMKPGRKPLPQPPEPVIMPVSADDFMDGLMEQVSKYGGPKVNVYLTVTVQRD